MRKIKDFVISLLPDRFLNWYRVYRSLSQRTKIIDQWEQSDKKGPAPHAVKQKNVQKYQRQYSCEILVETGTFLGDMVEVQRNSFKKIYSIEIGAELHRNAQRRFSKYPHIEIVLGDSAEVLNDVIAKLDKPSLFWLDGHYSGGITKMGKVECPIYGELDAILQLNIPYVILVDDARSFIGQNSYPAVSELESYFKSKNMSFSIKIEDDMLLIEKK